MRQRTPFIALVAAALVAAAGSVVSFASAAKRLSALEVRHGEPTAGERNQPGPEVASGTSTKDRSAARSCGD